MIRPSVGATDSGPTDALFESLVIRPRMRLVFDLGDVHYLSSNLLGNLINLKRKLGPLGGTIRLRNVSPELHELLRITRLDNVFEIEA